MRVTADTVRRWRTDRAYVVAHAAEGRRTVMVIPRSSGYSVHVLDSVLLGHGFTSAVREQVDVAVLDEVLAWIDGPPAEAS